MFNEVLLIVSIVYVSFLFGMEAYSVKHGIPTISARVQALGRSAGIVVVATCLLAGILLDHFFG